MLRLVRNFIQRWFSPRIWVPACLILSFLLTKQVDKYDYALIRVNDMALFHAAFMACMAGSILIIFAIISKVHRVKGPEDVIQDSIVDFIYAIVCAVILTIAIMEGWGDRSIKMLVFTQIITDIDFILSIFAGAGRLFEIDLKPGRERQIQSND